jgi:phosphatidylserine synthase
MISAIVLWYHRKPELSGQDPNSLFILTFVFVLAFLMVSNLDYFSLKHKAIAKNNHPFETLVLFILVLAILIIKAKPLFFPIGLIYLTSGPVVTLLRSRPKTLPLPPPPPPMLEPESPEELKARPEERS